MEAMYFAKRNLILNDFNNGSLKSSSTSSPNKTIQTTSSMKKNNQLTTNNIQRTTVISSKNKTSQLIQDHIAKQNNQLIKTDSFFKQDYNLDDNQMKSNSFYLNSNSNNYSNKRYLNRPVTPSTFHNQINNTSKENINNINSETIELINKKNQTKNNQIISNLLNNSTINNNSPSYMTFNNKSEISLNSNENNQHKIHNSINNFNETRSKIKCDDLNSKNMQNTFIQINRLTENHIKLKEQILNHYLNNASTSNSKNLFEESTNNFKNNSITNPANFESRSTLMDYHYKLRKSNNNSVNFSSFTKFNNNSVNKLKASTPKLNSPKLKMNNKEYSFNLKSIHNQPNQFFSHFTNKTTNSENQFRKSSFETSLADEKYRQTIYAKQNNTKNDKQYISGDSVNNFTKISENNLVNNIKSGTSNKNNGNTVVVNYLSNKLINNRINTNLNKVNSSEDQNQITQTNTNQQSIELNQNNINEIKIERTKNEKIFVNENNDEYDNTELDINQINSNKNLKIELDKENLILLDQINKKCNEWLEKHVMPFTFFNSSSISIDSSSLSFEN